MIRGFVLIAMLAAGCTSAEATVDAPSDFVFEVTVTTPSPIDRVTVNGMETPIGSGAVHATAQFANYTDGAMAPPIDFEFFSQSALMFTGHAVAGACQMLCEQSGCTDLSKFTDERIEILASDFRPYQYECLHCLGPTEQLGNCQ